MNRITCLLAVFLFAATSALAASPIAPFTAEYATLRNGEQLARTTIQLTTNADGTQTLRTTTRGTSNLARLAGLEVAEESIVRWSDGRPQTLRYDYRQDAAFKSKHRHGEFDWDSRRVHMVDGKNEARYALVDHAVDRHALTLALAADLSRQARTFDYRVAMKDAIEDVTYTPCGELRLSVPAGTFDTLCVERVRKKRTSTSWFADANGWIPVQIEQVESKGDVMTLRLVKLDRD